MGELMFGLLLVGAGAGLLIARRLLGRRPSGTADPRLRPAPQELAVMSGNRYAMASLALLELTELGLLDAYGRPTGRVAPPGLSPIAASLHRQLPGTRPGRSPGIDAAVKEHRRAQWRRLAANGLATSSEVQGPWRPAGWVAVGLAGVGLALVAYATYAWADFWMASALLVLVLAAGSVGPKAGLTAAGKALLRQARLDARPHDPRAGGRLPADPWAAASVIAVLGVGALYAVNPALVGVLGEIPADQLAAPYAMPAAATSAQSSGGDAAGCDASDCGSGGGSSGGDGGGCGGGCGGD